MNIGNISYHDLNLLSRKIKAWGKDAGFQQIGITNIDLSFYEPRLFEWLAKGFHGEMHYLVKHGIKRSRPALLLPHTIRVISARMDYLPQDAQSVKTLKNPEKAYIARYALGRDYHRVVRRRLQQLAERVRQELVGFGYRVFCDSAPVLEKALAEKAGLGWIGKHTNLINSKAGSWFFLGEIYTDLPLPVDQSVSNSHCGSCHACLTICPTQAIIAPYVLDARRCISYLTIEFKGIIPVALRSQMGNRIFGCDDCQLICPWNKFAKYSTEAEFNPRHQLHSPDLLTLFAWDEPTFLKKTEGSAIRRIRHEQWLRNIAIALGNATPDIEIIQALTKKKNHPSMLVREHVAWALQQQLRSQRHI